jgi:hypothetical protein
MKAYDGEDMQIHSGVTSILNGDERPTAFPDCSIAGK